jgi:pyridoxal phosphate enzyme (YggS family)
MNSIADNLARIRTRAGHAKLIAVSKTQSVATIRQALAAGQRAFGENRVQEAAEKFPELRLEFPDIELHLIGRLQTNKAVAAVKAFDVIQTLDRPQLADALAKAIEKTKRAPRLYIEVNIGAESQKAGILPEQLDPFFAYCRDICGLNITGLMCIPPHDQNPRPFFMRLRELADHLSVKNLSMGMSADYETAIECGATEIRVGAGVFGERKK